MHDQRGRGDVQREVTRPGVADGIGQGSRSAQVGRLGLALRLILIQQHGHRRGGSTGVHSRRSYSGVTPRTGPGGRRSSWPSRSRSSAGHRVKPVMTRQECAAMVVGGPTAVLDLGGLRILSDPTFDAPGPHGYLTKTSGPAVADDELGPVDLVLISHDNHPDNLDDRGRELALAAPLVLTTRSGARRLGRPAVSL